MDQDANASVDANVWISGIVEDDGVLQTAVQIAPIHEDPEDAALPEVENARCVTLICSSSSPFGDGMGGFFIPYTVTVLLCVGYKAK